MLNFYRERTGYLKSTERIFEEEIAAFKVRAELLAEENFIRAHTVNSLKSEVEILQKERDVVLLEIEELRRASDHEKSAKAHLGEIVAKAQRELKCQKQELSAFRKETLVQVKKADRLKERMKVQYFSPCPVFIYYSLFILIRRPLWT
jgi:hypothetical protein